MNKHSKFFTIFFIFSIVIFTFILNYNFSNTNKQLYMSFINADLNCDGISDAIYFGSDEVNITLGKENNNKFTSYRDVTYPIKIPLNNVSKIDFLDFDGDLCDDLITIDNNENATVFINKSKNTKILFEESMYKEQS